MIANYHTHTYLCRHAGGTVEEYVQEGIRNGLKILGFSDHVPYPFPNGYHSNRVRMDVSETGYYFQMIEQVREKYIGRIDIHIGFEAEYYPHDFEAMLKNIRKYPVEYLIMGQHYGFNEYDGFPSGRATEDKSRLTQYVNQVLEGLSTGMFTYLAHPDLINFTGDDAFYEEEMLRLLEGVNKRHIPVEINMLGLMGHRNYPDKRFWKLVKQTGTPCVIGCDAHQVRNVGDPEGVKACEKFLSDLGIQWMETVPLKPVK